jgi:glycosyltransferase involved in cell wall biosynthesis
MVPEGAQSLKADTVSDHLSQDRSDSPVRPQETVCFRPGSRGAPKSTTTHCLPHLPLAKFPVFGILCRLMIMYSEPLAHMLYAAADFVIVPSLFEPCGLTQMIAMRYGALPIVRRTGGLADTVFDADSGSDTANGYVFDGADEGACNGAIERAFLLFKESRERWMELSLRNMNSDMSWRVSAESYHELYRQIKVV